MTHRALIEMARKLAVAIAVVVGAALLPCCDVSPGRSSPAADAPQSAADLSDAAVADRLIRLRGSFTGVDEQADREVRSELAALVRNARSRSGSVAGALLGRANDHSTRLAALASLMDIGTEESLTGAMGLLRDHGSPSLRFHALLSIRMMPAPWRVRFAESVLEDSDPTVRVGAVNSLLEVHGSLKGGHAEAETVLRRVADLDSDPRVRARARAVDEPR